MLNKVMLIGNIGKDPETKNFDNGSIVNFSLATNESYKDKNGDRVDQTEWHNIKVSIPSLVKVAQEYLKKGMKIYLEGKIKTRSWESDQGKKYLTEIEMQSFKFLESNKAEQKPAPTTSAPVEPVGDLPF